MSIREWTIPYFSSKLRSLHMGVIYCSHRIRSLDELSFDKRE